MTRTASPMFGGGLPPIPRATRILIGAYVGLSILNAVLGAWARAGNLAEWLAFLPGRVLQGEVWRLVTWPLIADSPLSLIFGALILAMFAGRLEWEWGTRTFVSRTVLLTVVPTVLVTLLALVLPGAGRVSALGISPLSMGYLVAFASSLGQGQIMLFPLPIPLKGDQILWLEGGLLGLFVLFSGTVLGFLVPIVTFALALAWFRFDVFRGVRRRWLVSRRNRLEGQLRKLKARRSGLRVVSREEDDDEDDPRGRYLN